MFNFYNSEIPTFHKRHYHIQWQRNDYATICYALSSLALCIYGMPGAPDRHLSIVSRPRIPDRDSWHCSPQAWEGTTKLWGQQCQRENWTTVDCSLFKWLLTGQNREAWQHTKASAAQSTFKDTQAWESQAPHRLKKSRQRQVAFSVKLILMLNSLFFLALKKKRRIRPLLVSLEAWVFSTAL